MGYFSWLTMDGEQSISNAQSDRGATPVVMLIPEEFGGIDLIEHEYAGLGIFDGQDAHVLLALWNAPEQCQEPSAEIRNLGIRLGCDDRNMAKLEYPLRFVSYDYYKQTKCNYEDFNNLDPDFSKNCPDQGYFYE